MRKRPRAPSSAGLEMSALRTSYRFLSTAFLVPVLAHNSGLQIESLDYIKLLSRTPLRGPTWNFIGGVIKEESPDHLTVEGDLLISIFVRTGIDANATSPGEAISILDHERKHAGYFKESWNRLADAVNPYEGKYCRPACAQIAQEIVQWHGVYYASERSIANWQYDLDAYDNNQAVNEIAKSKSTMKFALEQLNAALEAFKTSGCTMPTAPTPSPAP